MMVQAANVVVDGFVFSGNQNGWGLRTEGESGTIDYGGYRIRNNIFTGNRVGMYLRDGRDTVVSNNLFHDSGAEGSAEPNGHGIYADDSAIDVTISDNQFRENAMSLSLVPGPGDDAANVSYSRNVSINDAHGVNFNGVDGLDIIDNTMQGGAEGAISLVGNGLDNVLVEGNRITEKGQLRDQPQHLRRVGERQSHHPREHDPRHASHQRRRRHGHHTRRQLLQRAAHDRNTTGSWTARRSACATGKRRRSTRDATGGAATSAPAPKAVTASSPKARGVIPAFAPWLTLSLSLRDTSTPVPAGGSATLFARDANLSSGGLADGPFFREAPATFASEPAGATLNPVTTTLSNNEVTATSAFTADPRPIEWSVTLDHQIVRLFNPDSPTTPASTRPLCRPDRCAVRPHADPAPTGGDHHRAGQPLHRGRPPVAGLHAPVGEAQPQRQALPTDRQLAARTYPDSAVGGAREARRLPRPARAPGPPASRRTATAGAPRRDEADRPPLWPAAGGDGLTDEGRSPVTHIGPLSC